MSEKSVRRSPVDSTEHVPTTSDEVSGTGIRSDVEVLPPEQEAATSTEPGMEDVVAQKDAEIAELRERLLYFQADLDNFKRRAEKRLKEALDMAAEPLLRDLLPALDNLERAEAHALEAGPEGYAGLVEGIGHIIRQFQDVLGRHGVEAISGAGDRFDPHVHEAMVQVPGDADGQVRDVFEKGYRLRGRLLRPAKVSVTKLAPSEGDG